MDDVRIFLSTLIVVWKTCELSPKLYFGQALELGLLITIDVGVVAIVCVHDCVEGVICESVLPTLGSKCKHLLLVIPHISREELKCGLLRDRECEIGAVVLSLEGQEEERNLRRRRNVMVRLMTPTGGESSGSGASSAAVGIRREGRLLVVDGRNKGEGGSGGLRSYKGGW
ncbi:unnamed protein product [Lactuca saligna]|uniref:Uncharacterized protein n=1 Tax=Lactuca saligna TaxID=75948 RepID=A0AA35ZFL0_LACSI|nr:unnamed protein product [Lactuca saligna]